MSVLENLNFIREATAFPCAFPDPVLIIEAGFTALGPAIWEAATFSCIDLVRLRAGISPWHSRGLKALVNNINPPEIQDKVNRLYKFIIPVERILHFMWIADLSSNFIANWQSQVFKIGACGEGTHGCTFSGTNPSWANDAQHGYTNVSYDPVPGSPICPGATGVEWIVHPNDYWSASFDMTPRPIFSSDTIGGLDMIISEFPPNGRTTRPQHYEPPWFGNTINAIYTRHGQNKTTSTKTYRFGAVADKPAVAAGGSCVISISDRPIHNQGLFPVNCLGKVIQSPV